MRDEAKIEWTVLVDDEKVLDKKDQDDESECGVSYNKWWDVDYHVPELLLVEGVNAVGFEGNGTRVDLVSDAWAFYDVST